MTTTIESQGGRELALPSAFITEVTSVTHLGSALTGWRVTEAGVLRGISFPCGPIVVEFTHGYAADAVPPAVTRVVQAVGKRIKKSIEAGGAKTKKVGPFEDSFDVQLDDDEIEQLTPYCWLLV